MIAYVFSGQGAQAPGMGKELYENSKAAKAVFDMAEAIRPGTIEQCFNSTKEELSITVNTQPCLFTVDLAAARALDEAGYKADMAAGFSLGEIAALAYAGVMSDDEAFKLVCKRAEYMQAAAQANPGGMMAVLGLPADKVVEICKEVEGTEPVNFNCPGQIVAAVPEEFMEELAAKVKENGGKGRKLAVSGAFHSSYMADAALQLGEYMESCNFNTPAITLYSNKTGKPYTENAKELVKYQVCNAVQWQSIVEDMGNKGVDTFIECGAGKVLCGLIGKTLSGVKAVTYSDILQEVTK